MITKTKYQAARTGLEKAQKESVAAMRAGDQRAADAANARAVKALAIIAAYKDQQANRK